MSEHVSTKASRGRTFLIVGARFNHGVMFFIATLALTTHIINIIAHLAGIFSYMYIMKNLNYSQINILQFQLTKLFKLYDIK